MKIILSFFFLLLFSETAFPQAVTVLPAPDSKDPGVAQTVADGLSKTIGEVGGMSNSVTAAIANLAAVETANAQAQIDATREAVKQTIAAQANEKFGMNGGTNKTSAAQKVNFDIASMGEEARSFAWSLARAGQMAQTGDLVA